jgi:hypothetical protein
MMEAPKRPYFEPHHQSLLSQAISGDSTVEAAVHQKVVQVFLAEAVQEDVADRIGMAEKLQSGPVVLASAGWDSQAGADHPAPPGKVAAVQMDPGLERNRA